MTEERYIKIKSCRGCDYSGHSTSCIGSKYHLVFICSNPINGEKNVPREKIGLKYFPITGYGQKFEDNLIPVWCKLPKPE